MVVRAGQQLQQIAAIYRSDWLQLWCVPVRVSVRASLCLSYVSLSLSSLSLSLALSVTPFNSHSRSLVCVCVCVCVSVRALSHILSRLTNSLSFTHTL